MGRYVIRRLLQMIPVFIGTTLLIFFMVYALPGDPVRASCVRTGAMSGRHSLRTTPRPRQAPQRPTSRPLRHILW